MISMDAQTQNTLDKLYTAETAYEKIKTEKEEVAALRIIHSASLYMCIEENPGPWRKTALSIALWILFCHLPTISTARPPLLFLF